MVNLNNPNFDIFNLTVGNNSFLIQAPSGAMMMLIAKHYKATVTTPMDPSFPWKSVTTYAFTRVDKDTVNPEDVISYQSVCNMIQGKTPNLIGG